MLLCSVFVLPVLLVIRRLRWSLEEEEEVEEDGNEGSEEEESHHHHAKHELAPVEAHALA